MRIEGGLPERKQHYAQFMQLASSDLQVLLLQGLSVACPFSDAVVEHRGRHVCHLRGAATRGNWALLG